MSRSRRGEALPQPLSHDGCEAKRCVQFHPTRIHRVSTAIARTLHACRIVVSVESQFGSFLRAGVPVQDGTRGDRCGARRRGLSNMTRTARGRSVRRCGLFQKAHAAKIARGVHYPGEFPLVRFLLFSVPAGWVRCAPFSSRRNSVCMRPDHFYPCGSGGRVGSALCRFLLLRWLPSDRAAWSSRGVGRLAHFEQSRTVVHLGVQTRAAGRSST